MNKQFMVVTLPKEGRESLNGNYILRDNYDDAFEVFNGHVSLETEQIFKQPKGEKPLRAVLKDEVVELWVIARTTDLITN